MHSVQEGGQMKYLTSSELGDLINQAVGSFSFRLAGGPDCWWYPGSKFTWDQSKCETYPTEWFGHEESEAERARRLRG